jgi:uncharacterized protein YllA (UPF0747 family)
MRALQLIYLDNCSQFYPAIIYESARCSEKLRAKKATERKDCSKPKARSREKHRRCQYPIPQAPKPRSVVLI